jgi:hypothetical protein
MSWPTFNGYDLFLHAINWLTLPIMQVEHPYDIIKFLGRAYPYSTLDETELVLKGEILGNGKADIQDVTDFVEDKLGRLEQFWVPTRFPDIEITAAFTAADNSLEIEDVEYKETWLSNMMTGRWLFLEWPDGTYKIVGVRGAPHANRIFLDRNIGKAATADEVPYIQASFLLFCRLNLDEIEWNYETSQVARLVIGFRTLPHESPTVSTTTTTTTTTTVAPVFTTTTT